MSRRIRAARCTFAENFFKTNLTADDHVRDGRACETGAWAILKFRSDRMSGGGITVHSIWKVENLGDRPGRTIVECAVTAIWLHRCHPVGILTSPISVSSGIPNRPILSIERRPPPVTNCGGRAAKKEKRAAPRDAKEREIIGCPSSRNRTEKRCRVLCCSWKGACRWRVSGHDRCLLRCIQASTSQKWRSRTQFDLRVG
jgi:hypothetical protein